MDARRKFQNVRDPSILTWSGELLTPESYEKYKDTGFSGKVSYDLSPNKYLNAGPFTGTSSM